MALPRYSHSHDSYCLMVGRSKNGLELERRCDDYFWIYEGLFMPTSEISAADFMCNECVIGFPGKSRSVRKESPLRLPVSAYMPASVYKSLIELVPEVGIEPTRF